MTTYEWNVLNRLVRIDFPDATYAAYRYDAQGRRIEKDVNGALTRYVYDGDAILLEYDGADVLQARYSHGEEVDQPLAMTRDAESFFYHTDHLGSVRLLTDGAGSVANRYDYDAFGNWEATSYETVASPFGFTARERDAESGLMFYRARYYDPKIGRFISEDPIGFDGKDLNLYRYVFNWSVIAVDPSGTLFELGYRFAIASAFAGAQIGALLGAFYEIIQNPNDISACTIIAAAAGGAFMGATLGAFVEITGWLDFVIHVALHVVVHEAANAACEYISDAL